MSDCTIKLLLFWILVVVCRYIHGMPGKRDSLCYLKKGQQQHVLCIPARMDTCSSDYIHVTSVKVYVIPTCSSASQCGSDVDCCSPGNVTPTQDHDSVIWNCTTTQCLSGLNTFDLPVTSNYHLIEFIFSCGTSSSNGSTEATRTSHDNANSGDKSTQTGVYVAVPVVLVLLAIALAATVFLWRRKRQSNRQTQNAETKDYFSTPAQRVEGDSNGSGFGDYSEINTENICKRVNDQAVDTDYNTLNLRDLPIHSDPNYGFLAAKKSSANEKTAENNDMYSHIGGTAQNVRDDVIPDHTYNTANVSRLTGDVTSEDENTYNHLDADKVNDRISDKGKNGESDYAYSKPDSKTENNSENTDEPVRHDYFVKSLD